MVHPEFPGQRKIWYLLGKYQCQQSGRKIVARGQLNPRGCRVMRKTHNIWWQIQMRHDIHCGSAVISRQPLAAAHKSAMLTKYIFVRLPLHSVTLGAKRTSTGHPAPAGGISDGGLNPATDTNMLLTAYRGESHSTSDIIEKRERDTPVK